MFDLCFNLSKLICLMFTLIYSSYSYGNESLCFGDNNFVCINEFSTGTNLNNRPISYYTIENKLPDSPGQILAFGVTNSGGGVNYQAYLGNKYNVSWSAVTLNQAEWDVGNHTFTSRNSGGTDLFNAVSGAVDSGGFVALGSFVELFGSAVVNGEPQYVNFFWNTSNGTYHLKAGDNLAEASQFNFYGLPESEATVFGANQAILATTVTAAAPVPELTTTLMLFLGLIMVVSRKIKFAD